MYIYIHTLNHVDHALKINRVYINACAHHYESAGLDAGTTRKLAAA